MAARGPEDFALLGDALPLADRHEAPPAQPRKSSKSQARSLVTQARGPDLLGPQGVTVVQQQIWKSQE